MKSRNGVGWERKGKIERERGRFEGNKEGFERKMNIGNYGRDREGK